MAARNHAGHRKVSELQIKVDELQNTNRGLEHHILNLTGNKEAVSSHIDTLTRKNEQLCKELTEIDKMAGRLEKEKDQALADAEEELDEAKKEIRRKQYAIDNLEITVRSLISDANFAKEQLEKSEAELGEKKQENTSLNVLLDQLQEDNSRLSNKVGKMEKTEKKRILVTERSRTASPSKLDAFVKSLEEERDQYKSEADHLRKMLRCRSCSPKRSPSRQDTEIKKSIRERDELQDMLTKFERHMAEIQANVKVLTSERDKINAFYERAQQENTQLRKELMQASKTPKASSTAQTILRRVETERDCAISDLCRMTTERDSLRERMKIVQETAISDRAHLEQRTEELQSTIQLMENERVEQKSNLALMKGTLSTVENEVKMLTRRTADFEDEVRQQKSECDALRLLNNKTEHSLDETQRRLSMKLNEIQIAQDKIVRLNGKIDEQSSQNLTQKDEIAMLQRTLSDLHKEKDSLILSVDEKTEKISSLENDVSLKERTIQRMLREMEEATRQSSKTISNHEQEISHLCRQLDELSDELSRTGRERETVVQENGDLHEQLSKSRVEIQTFTHKLKDSQNELQDVKLKLQGAITDIARLESSVNSKEKENRDLLENYRKSSSLSDIWENKFYQLEKEFNSVKLDLLKAESERRRLKERSDSLELEMEQHITSEQSYKSQLCNLAISAARMEEEMRQAKAEKSSALGDLATTRELCIKLDSGKELINSQLKVKTQDVERLQHELESACSEMELLRKQLASERSTVKNLEVLLVSNQEEEFQSQVRSKDLESELQLLRDRLLLAESKLGTHNREAGQLKNKIAQQEAELEITKRQLTTERFERQVELAVKELRRQNIQTPPSYRRSPSPSRISPERPFRSPERSSRSPEKSLDREFAVKEMHHHIFQTLPSYRRSPSPSRITPERPFGSPERRSRSIEKSLDREFAVKDLHRHNFQTLPSYRRSPSPSRISPERPFRSPERLSRSPEKSLDSLQKSHMKLCKEKQRDKLSMNFPSVLLLHIPNNIKKWLRQTILEAYGLKYKVLSFPVKVHSIRALSTFLDFSIDFNRYSFLYHCFSWSLHSSYVDLPNFGEPLLDPAGLDIAQLTQK
ncbi:testis-specific gene 10 protein [Mantella aurantiaca]